MRRLIVSIAVSVAGVTAVVAAGWGIQRLTLSMPPRAAQAAVRAEQWVHTYRHSVVVFHAGDRRFRGECLRAWFLQPHARGRSRHWHGRHEGSLLLLARAPVALATGKGLTAVLARGKGRVVLAVGHRLPRLPTFLAVGIGCTGVLSSALTSAVQSSLPLHLERDFAANQPALELETQFRHERLTIYISPRDYRPLVVIGAQAGHVATARLYFPPLTTADATRIRQLLHQKGIPLPR